MFTCSCPLTLSISLSLSECFFFTLNPLVRSLRNAHPLKYNTNLNQAAAIHSQAMLNGKFFDHENSKDSTIRDPSDRAAKAGYSGSSIGENIALEPGDEQDPWKRAFIGWLKSPGHRENMGKVIFFLFVYFGRILIDCYVYRKS